MVAFIWRSGKVMWRAALRGCFPPLLPLHNRPYEDEKEQKICPPALDGYHHAAIGKVFWRDGKVIWRSTHLPASAPRDGPVLHTPGVNRPAPSGQEEIDEPIRVPRAA